MAREIHDTLAQGFTGIVLQLEAAEQVLEGSPSEVSEHLARAKNLGRERLQEARRSVWGLLPRALEERALETVLQEQIGQFGADGQGESTFSLSGNSRELPSHVQVALLRIRQESLTNMGRHANATHVKVSLAFDSKAVYLGVQDDGVGADLDGTTEVGGGFGLMGMEQRARLLGGTLVVKSEKGKGTHVEVRVPLS